IRSWDSMTLVVKRSPLKKHEIERIREFSGSRRFDLIYYPGMKQEEGNKYVKIPSDEYFTGFNTILNNKTRMPFLDNYLFDIKPVRDDNPFSHYYLKLSNIKAIYEKMGSNWLYFLEEGYFVPIIFIITVILSVLLIMFSVTFNALRKDCLTLSSLPIFLYFSMLGFGFMFVEVVLIQKSILLLENPSYAVAVILTSILISSGAGSLLSGKLAALRTSLCLLILSLLVLLYGTIHPLLLNILTPCSLTMRILVIAAAIVPLGFFMGIPFPLGIQLLGRKHGELIPWAWAINACISVVAPVLAIILALRTGFQTVIWMGALAYILAFVSLRKMMT
ncbi:MAG: hypothetical protein OEM19_03035, partial [Deltaproteobacteria bacterium]|nr:hypothetical protein [Deltaproteobacteria bacterium]